MVCSPKDQCGLGISDLQIKNSALFGKWLTEDGVWQTLLRRKYIGSKALSQVYWKPGDSHFWAGLMATKKLFLRFGAFNIKDVTEIRFWEDKWLGDTTLREQYPALYNIVRHKSDTIATVMQSSPPNMTFRQTLFGPRLVMWNALLGRLTQVQLSQGPDEFHWNLQANGLFSIDSMYRALIHSGIPVDDNNKIWKMNIPLKLLFFAWYLRKGVILTKDNLVKHKGSTKFVFCT